MRSFIYLLLFLSSLAGYSQGEIGYHVTESDNLFKTINAGTTWQNTFTGTVESVDFINESTGYFVSSSGNLFKTTDSGQNWTNTFTSAVAYIDFVNDSTGYFISTSGNLFKTTDSGNSWNNTFTSSVATIDFINDSTGYHVTTSGNLYKTSDSGQNWQNTSTGVVDFIDFVNDSTGYHVTESGNLFKTNNSGTTWTNTFTSTVSMIDFINDSIGYHVTVSGNLFRTTDSGNSWTNTFTSNVQYIEFVDDSITDTYAIDVQASCDSLLWIDGNVYTSSNFTATDTLVNVAGYDSIITLNLTIVDIDLSLNQNGSLLTSNQSGAFYQWLSCPSMTELADETNQSFTATTDGNYAVIVNYNGCIDTSNCLSVIGAKLNQMDSKNQLKVFPNPNNGQLSIDLGQKYERTNIQISTMNGQLVYNHDFSDSQLIDLELNIPPGIYILKIRIDENEDLEEFIYKIQKE